MGTLLTERDEGVHPTGTATNWNESRYVDFWDARQRIGGWFRIGNRPNEGRAEVSACINLPDGTTAFSFERARITGNGLISGGQSWEIVEPWFENRVRHRSEALLLADPWLLTIPKLAFANSPRTTIDVDLVCRSNGLANVMGSDQDHIGLIFLPGQADFHYQHLARTTGTVRVGNDAWTVNGLGGKDHSWGPRNWHAKIWLRWLIAAIDDDNGFLLVRAVGPTKRTRSGYVLREGRFHLVDDFEMRNVFGSAPHFELQRVELAIRSGPQVWRATGTPRAWLPLRHLQKGENGEDVTLRIVKSPADWRFEDGRTGEGMLEYHDRLDAGRPVGLDD